MLMRSDQGTAPDGRGQPPTVSTRRLIAVCTVLVLIGPTVSYLRALTYPGNAGVGVRTVEWIRDSGGAPVVDAVENWWFTRHAPTGPAPDPGLLPRAGTPPAPGVVSALPALPMAPPVPGEGVWSTGRQAVGGAPALFTTFVRPDAAHPSVIAGIARFDRRLVRGRLIAGTKEPDAQSWPEGGQVPAADRAGLVAAFNSGFKMVSAHGGFYADGRHVRQLRNGAASLVIDRTGQMSVGMWGRDARLGPDIAAVRQNLELIVDNGAPVPGLQVNARGRWGSARNQLQYTWRSGVGVDAAGNLYYAGGNQLTLTSLARALATAGVVRGMELDIHPRMVDLFTYRPGPDGAPVPSPLLPAMPGPSTRYLEPDQRDFVAVTLRPDPAR
jgi:hypothetical protein